jgi:hypothetical protein
MSYCLQFVTAEAVGWIPYYENFRDVPQNAYYQFASEGKRKWLACDMLFYSGNTPTPEDQFFQPQRQFAELLQSKNFRGALSLRDIRLYCYDDGRCVVTHKSLKKKQHVGYTPIRLFGFRSNKVRKFLKGHGSTVEPSVEYTATGARLELSSKVGYGRMK